MKGKNKIKLLISPSNERETRALAASGLADIIDLKNPAEGSLGANFPWVIRSAVKMASGASFSVAIGDIFCKPGSFSLAAYAAGALGADYVKAGFFGFADWKLAASTGSALKKALAMSGRKINFVFAGYADWKRFGGLSHRDVLKAASRCRAETVMLDTYFKDGSSLFDALTPREAGEFVRAARRLGMKTALAGSVRKTHCALLREIAPDIVGVRGGVCRGFDRNSSIDTALVKEFREAISF